MTPNQSVMPYCLQSITKEEFSKIAGPASMHAIGHVAANLSFAAVAISLTHTVKTLEPVFSVVLSKLILGQSTPLPVVGTLVPVMVGHCCCAHKCLYARTTLSNFKSLLWFPLNCCSFTPSGLSAYSVASVALLLHAVSLLQ